MEKSRATTPGRPPAWSGKPVRLRRRTISITFQLSPKTRMPTEKMRRFPLSTSQTTTTEHHPALAHQFDSMEQQQDASTFGMWVFLLTEIMMFGGLFTAKHHDFCEQEYPHAKRGSVQLLLHEIGRAHV